MLKEGEIMTVQERELKRFSRRDVLLGSAAIAAGGVLGGPGMAFATAGVSSQEGAPPLPWKWTRLDPDEAGRRAYRLYFDQGGCGTASYLSMLSMLREEVGYPWTGLPDMMMIHAAGGFAGHGTLCGALAGASCIINLVGYGPDKDAVYKPMIDWLYSWYSEQEFPTTRFDDISKMPGQRRLKAMSPLCHTSVTRWTLATGVSADSAEKKERCAKVTGEVVYVVVDRLNEHFAGRWTPPAWQPPEGVEHCLKCHGPDTITQAKAGMQQQQGHMDCLMCHRDHTK
jgi:hypothetical protein